MYHSVIFDDEINTWDDWGLVPNPIPVIASPELKMVEYELPISNGLLDNTDLLTGEPLYENREGSLSFYIYRRDKLWCSLYSDILDYLHGRVRKMVLEDDPNYFYNGRFEVDGWETGDDYSQITINYSLDPYKTLISDFSVKEL